MDGAANVYVAGSFEGTAGFDGGDLTARLGTVNQVVVSYAADGTHRWDHQIAGSSLGPQMAVAASEDGSAVYVASTFADSLDLGDGASVSASGAHLYVAKLRSTDGSVESHAVIRGDLGIRGLVAQGTSVLLAGAAYTSAEVAGVTLTDDFIAELDASLSPVSARHIATGSAVEVRAVGGRRGGGFVAVGTGYGVVDFGCASAVGAADQELSFVVAFDASRTCEWSYSVAVPIDFWDVASDSDGGVYAAGDCGSEVDFGGGNRCTAGNSGFVLRLDSTGAYDWDRVLSSPTYGVISGLASSADGVVAVGSFTDSFSIGGSTLAGSPARDSIVVSLTRAGGVRRLRTFTASDDDFAGDVVVGIGDSTVVLGAWTGTITLGTAAYLSRSRPSGGPSQDVYVTRLPTM